jgi:Flp pilus assembly protein RcpC/CpaB
MDMNNRKSNNILVVGVAVFAVGAALAFFGLRSTDKAVATPQAQKPGAVATTDPNVRTVNVGPAGVSGVTTFTVPKGKQAVAVELPGVAGLAGYAKPGDTVNVYGTIKTGADQPNTKLKTPLVKLALTGVKVLDVRAPAPGTAGTATYLLALDVADAEKVIFYAKFESLWLALTAEDQKPVTSPGRSYQNLL